MKAILIDLGRGKVNKEVDVKDYRALHKEIGKHLRSKGWGMEETETPDLYNIEAGFRTVGQVQIIEQ